MSEYEWVPAERRKLRRHKVELLSAGNFVLKCEQCGQVFCPMLPLRRGYWRCPNKCNWPQKSE
jgi:hypothetical protein